MALISKFVVTAIKTGTYTASWGELVRCDPSGGAFTVNLPTGATNDGRQIIVKNTTTSTNTITLDPAGGETIDGAATATMTTARQAVRISSDGTNLLVI